jgi:hypothetical protein
VHASPSPGFLLLFGARRRAERHLGKCIPAVAPGFSANRGTASGRRRSVITPQLCMLSKSMWTVFMTILRCNPWLPSRIAANGAPPGLGYECLFTTSAFCDCHSPPRPFPEEFSPSWICRLAAAAPIVPLVSAQYSPS